jgi:hypothetical protein
MRTFFPNALAAFVSVESVTDLHSGSSNRSSAARDVPIALASAAFFSSALRHDVRQLQGNHTLQRSQFHFLLDALLREEVTQAAAPMWILFSSCFGCNHV